jgi:hypothetical protein
MSSLWLNKCRRNVYSQNGEDGVIEAIFEKIGVTNRWLVDVGASDGVMWSNTRNRMECGWSGVLIEKDQNLCQRINLGNSICATVTGNLDRLIPEVPKIFDFLSIDVDGSDAYIWNHFVSYHPRVVCIEVDSGFEPGKRDPRGMDIQSMVELGKSKGYELALHTGNAIFVTREEAPKLDIDPDNWQELFDRSWL